MLGPVDVQVDGRPVRIGSRTQRLILAALAHDLGRPLTRDRLAHAVWGDHPPEASSSSLKSHVSRLRAALPADVIETRAGGYVLTVGPDQVDACRFEQGVVGARTLEELDRVLATWRGRPFGEFGDASPFAGETTRLAELYALGQQRRAELLLGAGRADEAAAALERLLADEPLRESAWVALLDALVDAGRAAEAVDAAHRYRDVVADVGLVPSARFERAEGRAFAAASGRDADGASPARAGLPRRLVPLVGRDAEVGRVADALADRRVVTLTGPGGVGKTTVAVEAARRVGDAFPDGVWLVPLADVDEAEAVTATIARTVGAPTTDPLDRAVADYLAGRRAMVLLDNAEHVLPAAVAAARHLTAATDHVHLLLTSRRPLALPGEVVVEVAPLDPAAARELFEQRARDAGVRLRPDQRELAGRVCDRLDRLPLALEMAAARLRGLALEDLADRLDDRLRLLGGQDTPGRHRTLREVVAWSYELLPGSRRRMLDDLSVFPGPFDLDAAEDVCEVGDAGAGALADLVDASLVQRSRDATETRYELLETVRQFAAEQLAATDRRDGTWGRSIEHHRGLLDRIGHGLGGPDERAWAASFDRHLANLEAAQHRAVHTGRIQTAAQMVATTYPLVYQRLRADVGAWVEPLLPFLPGLDAPLRARTVAVAAVNRLHRGDPDGAADLLHDLPDHPAARQGHEVLSDLHLYRGDLARAQWHAERSAALAAEVDDRFTAVFATAVVALAVGYAGHPDEALRLVEDRRPAAARLGSPLASSWLDYTQAELVAEDDPTLALDLLDGTVAAADEAGWSLLAGVARLTAGSLRARVSDPDEAAPAFRRLVDHWDRLGDRAHQWTTLRNLVELLARGGDASSAATLLGAVSAAPLPTYGSEQRRLDRVRGSLDDALGTREAARLYRAGRAMSHDDAVTLARDALGPPT